MGRDRGGRCRVAGRNARGGQGGHSAAPCPPRESETVADRGAHPPAPQRKARSGIRTNNSSRPTGNPTPIATSPTSWERKGRVFRLHHAVGETRRSRQATTQRGPVRLLGWPVLFEHDRIFPSFINGEREHVRPGVVADRVEVKRATGDL